MANTHEIPIHVNGYFKTLEVLPTLEMLPKKLKEKLSGIRYSYNNGPDKIRDVATARRLGGNCQAFVHLFINEFYGFLLPPEIRSKEFLENDVLFPQVLPGQKLKVGNIIIVGQIANEHDPRKHHVGIYAGIDEERNHTLFDLNKYNGNSSVWPFSRLFEYYEKIYAIKEFNLLMSTQTTEVSREVHLRSGLDRTPR